jgi:hypothetical protein
MAPAAGVRAFLNNFFRILRLFTLILLSASEDLTVSGDGREQQEGEPACPGGGRRQSAIRGGYALL